MLWKIYYDDNSTFTDKDGIAFDAPRLGVQFVVQKLKHNKKYLILSGADYYTYQENIGWWYCTEMDMFDHLFTAGSNQLFIKGKMVAYEKHHEMVKRVHAELEGKKDSWRHMPLQQANCLAEVIGEI